MGFHFLDSGAVAAILWAPIGAGLGYLGGKWSESSWEPCRQVLQESISKFDPMAALATKLKGALDRAGVQTLAIGTEAGVGKDALAKQRQEHLYRPNIANRASPLRCLVQHLVFGRSNSRSTVRSGYEDIPL